MHILRVLSISSFYPCHDSYIKTVNGLNHQSGDVITPVSVNGVTKLKLNQNLSSPRLLETINTTSTANHSKEQKHQQEKQSAKELAKILNNKLID
jgi:hypothetical protein